MTAPSGESDIRRKRIRLAWILGLLVLLAVVSAAILLQRSPEPIETVDAPSPSAPAQPPSAEKPAAPGADIRQLPAREQLGRAFEAAFGRRGSARVAVDGEQNDYREQVEFTPGTIIWPDHGPVLISEGEVIDGSHASTGKLAVHYLRQAEGTFRVDRRFVPAIETGSFGRVGSWSISDDLASHPVLHAEGGGTWQGHTCRYVTLAELAPDGVVELARFPSYYSDAGAAVGSRPIELTGKVTNVVPGRSFDVAYSGSRSFVEHYERRGSSYVLTSGRAALQEC